MREFILAVSPELLNYLKFGGQFLYTLVYMGITWQLLVRMEQKLKELKPNKEKRD